MKNVGTISTLIAVVAIISFAIGNLTQIGERAMAQLGRTVQQPQVKDISGSVVSYLRAEGMSFTRTVLDGGHRGELVVYSVTLAGLPYNIAYLVFTEWEQLAVIVTLDEKVAAGDRARIIEYLTRVNYDRLVLGNFQMDLSDGEVQFRISKDVELSVISPEIVDQLTAFAIHDMDKYLPGMLDVIGGRTPEAALARIQE